MKTKVVVLLLLLIFSTASFGQGDIAVGPYYGMAIPVLNDAAETGAMYGLQAKVSVMPMLSVGLHYSSRSYGNPSILFHEGEADEVELESDGGDVTSIGADLYLGKSGGLPGANFYLMASYGTFKWTRDGFEDVSESALLIGPGAEIVLPMKLGIEGRAMFEVASTGNNGTYKSAIWFIGLNYHLSLKPM